MYRRIFLKSLAYSLTLNFLPIRTLAAEQNTNYNLAVLMFHKVTDFPEYPEDISTEQLQSLFAYMWQNNYYPVNISDILDAKIDLIVPKGYQAVAISADDAHRSIFFDLSTAKHPQSKNSASFIDIFKASLLPYNYQARATFFISAVGDDRYSKAAEGYFGSHLALKEIVTEISQNSGLELAYHTRIHKIMKNMNAEQVNAIITDQMQDFQKLGVFEQIQPILAYPYGVAPSPDGIKELQRLGFKGAVLAFPGANEANYTSLTKCVYNKKLLTDPFLIPRVGIGAYTYASKDKAKEQTYSQIDPIADFKKDVENLSFEVPIAP